MKTTGLPVEACLPDMQAALATNNQLILQAPPGAGKSTLVPLALLPASWLQPRKILLLEPRRLAARAIAARMADLLGQTIGQTVGYRMRMDRKIGPTTQLEVLTEGMLTRRLQSDPELADVGLIIFDEFHERSLQADLGLALCLEVQAALRDDLRLLIMSATLNVASLQALLPEAVCVSSEGRSHPLTLHYAHEPIRYPGTRELVATIRRALQQDTGDVLVFLPGVGDIKRLQTELTNDRLPDNTSVLPLFGDLPVEEQDRAIRPSATGARKIVLATNIAETSLTIEGVRIVVDSGWSRRQRFEIGSGMSRLDTLRISRASADQRAGRAGRLGPGVCYRLWTESEQRQLVEHTPAEIMEADLAPLALDLACWGSSDPRQLTWLDPPPSASFNQARGLLAELGALDPDGRLSREGKEMAKLGLHPRLAHMLLRARELQAGHLGCCLAAVLTERDFLRKLPGERDIDLAYRVRLVYESARRDGHDIDGAGFRRVQRAASHFQAQLKPERDRAGILSDDTLPQLAAYAYPDRIAKRRTGSTTRYLLRNGKGAILDASQVFNAAEYLVVTDLDAGQREAKIFSAIATDLTTLEEQFAEQIEVSDRVAWDRQTQTVIARQERRLGAILLNDALLASPDPDAISTAMLDGIRDMGMQCLPWTDTLREWQARVTFVGRIFGDDPAFQDWPQVSDSSLEAGYEQWLRPFLLGISRRDHLARLDFANALASLLTWEQQQRLEALAPTHCIVPSGSRIGLQYSGYAQPVLAVRLQELFGLSATPRIAGDRVALTLHLLSPARRPVQVTNDLAGFWKNSYFEVRKDLRGRYPKHPWPDDPLSAPATRRTKKT